MDKPEIVCLNFAGINTIFLYKKLIVLNIAHLLIQRKLNIKNERQIGNGDRYTMRNDRFRSVKFLVRVVNAYSFGRGNNEGVQYDCFPRYHHHYHNHF